MTITHTKGKKQRVTVSISREARQYLKSRAHGSSISAIVETMIEEDRSRLKMEELEAKERAYYDSLSVAAIEEEADWGRVGAASLTQLED